MKQFREDRIARMLAEAAHETKTGITSDAVLKQLEKIAATRKDALEMIRGQYKSGTISPIDLAQAEASLAEANVRIELRKEDLAKSPANIEAAQLARQARELHLDWQQDELRLELLAQKLAALTKARDMVDQYDFIKHQMLP